jgi:hypothetical protein
VRQSQSVYKETIQDNMHERLSKEEKWNKPKGNMQNSNNFMVPHA